MGNKKNNALLAMHGILLSAVCAGIISCSATKHDASTSVSAPTSERNRTLLDAGWRFHPGDISPNNEVISASYNDADWSRVDVPHDYIQGGAYASTNDRGHGYMAYDVGWYRKHITIPESDHGKILRLDFDGVFRDSEVWLNGQSLGKHRSGYTPFSYDITKLAKVGADNIITVRVDPRQFEGWWYEGAGIYRHVHLTALSQVHLQQWGVHVVPNVNGDVAVTTTLDNQSPSAAQCKVVSEILDPAGHSVATLNATETAPAGVTQDVLQKATLADPKLWSIESPNLYVLRTTLMENGQPIDSASTTFGFRSLRFDKDKGFFLNGKHVEIYGTASHQDFAGVGIAVPDSLQAWRVEQLQKFGCNAWRTAHNPPSEALLDACDRMGMLVMDENRHLGDAYTHHSPKGTTATDFNDLTTMIRRDRNHPSIIMWSMCNEEGLQGTPEGAAIFTKMMEAVHRFDDTRPITSAMNAGYLTPAGDAYVEDIIGVNYSTNRYDAIRKLHPDKMIFGSEDTNEKTTRGEYADVKETGMRSAFNLSEKDWQAVVDRPFMAGSFTWTGFDYKGEPNPYGWPDISNNTGLLDVCGYPKDKAYYFKSCWTEKPMVHLVPSSWNWAGKEGQPIRVAAFSNAKKVELFLNGKSLGALDVPHDGHAEWQVPYSAGDLTAKALDGDKVVAADTVQTTGAPVRIIVHTDRTTLRAGAEDAVVAQISIVDDQGRVVPDIDKLITFTLTGPGQILGVGNGNPADHDTDRADHRNTLHGLCIAVVEAGNQSGLLELTASGPGLNADYVKIKVR